MTPSNIRAELEQLAARGCTAADLNRLNSAWSEVRAETPSSYHPIIDDRLKALRRNAPSPDAFTPEENSDFTLHELNGYWHWYSCGLVFGNAYCSVEGFDTPAEAIADAVDFLTGVYDSCPEDNDFSDLPPGATPTDIELADISPYQSGIHFALYQYESQPGWYWQGLSHGDFAHLTADRGYLNARLAAADCLFCLHVERGYSIEEAVTLVYELALPIHTVLAENPTAVTPYIEQLKAAEFAEHWSHLYPSSQDAIESAIQVLPAAEREQARCEMAFRTQPMPEPYWPAEA